MNKQETSGTWFRPFAWRPPVAALGLLIRSITQKKSFLFPDPVSFIGVIVVMHRKSEKINRQ